MPKNNVDLAVLLRKEPSDDVKKLLNSCSYTFFEYTFFEQCSHRMACACCDFYTPMARPYLSR